MAEEMGDFDRHRGVQNEQYFDLVDTITIDLATKSIQKEKENPYQNTAKELCNALGTASKDRSKRNEQIEAVIEMIEEIRKWNTPSGLVLNSEMVSGKTSKVEESEFNKVKKVLGRGNSAGEVILVRDKQTKQEMAYKTIMISQFNANEIRAWVSLADEKMAPELYHFELKGNRVEFTMECVRGLTLEEVNDSGKLFSSGDPKMARDFSLCVLDDLLGMLEKLREMNFIHGDLHGGNVMLDMTMAVKLIDFGRARNLLQLDVDGKIRNIKNDILGVIRIFCALYSGVDFDDLGDAVKQLQTNNLSKLSENMNHIPMASRKELYTLMTMLFDTIRKPVEQEAFGDISKVATHVKTLLPADIEEFKKKVAVILFPEFFQIKIESGVSRGQSCHDGTDSRRTGDSPIWDGPDMNVFIKNVTTSDLEMLAKDSF